jgi:hypothetical protein
MRIEHLALHSEDPAEDARRLCAAGATRLEGEADAEGFGQRSPHTAVARCQRIEFGHSWA